MKVEENIAWSELLKVTIATAQHGNDSNRIATATETLQQTAHQFVKVLNERARLLANSAQFDTALRDATAIRAILPGSGLGYLATGDVYCQQGRYAAAISIYDQGLQAVPESDACYHQLQQQRLAAIANNNKRVDFISRLPLDIVITNIVPRMEPACLQSDVLFEPLYVSRGWRKRILQCPHGLTFDFGQESETFARGHDHLVRFAPYVQTLSGCFYKDVRLDDLFSRARFSNLKDLDISGDATTSRLPLVKGLRLVADTLTHLFVNWYREVQLRDILETCPNLVSLDVVDVDMVVPPSPSSRYPKITRLAIHDVTLKYCRDENMIDVLSRFPSLLSFEITPMPDSSLLKILHEYCPYLQVLYFGEKDYRREKPRPRPNGRKGIVSAYLGGLDADVNDYRHDDLVQFLYLNRNSLEDLEFEGTIVDDDAFWKLENGQVIQQRDDQYSPLRPGDDDPTQSDTSFMQLGRIAFSGAEAYLGGAIITWLISNAPNIKTLSLIQNYIQTNVANAMIQLKHLSKLQLHQMVTVDDYEGMIQFLQHHVGMGNQSTLEELTLLAPIVVMRFGAAWIPLIARLESLKNLKLLGSIYYDESIHIMKEIAQGCPALEKLTLGGHRDTLDDGMVRLWRDHSNLKYLRIGAESLSNNDATALCTFRNLKQLQLQCDVSDDLLDLLEERIPEVEFIDGNEW
ncbi:hypothetical protein O0I10_011651 [Lichtheimia ornata]|uniref:Uncharacterized protein n=1 Tax=Lichtheimia ornata TaxID=688661 RepID=A0AAD7UUX0_9FUNG|nr:uncharacterized protein O0I10_011651 [Lichtheimia ornata]KAJ8652706.1 hypothetical protein O0I10_011651 [Lichtheimia ornata]